MYSDVIAAASLTHEPTNYGEYSGAPTEGPLNTPIPSVRIFSSVNHKCAVVDLLTRPPHRPDGKILIISGGIANFANVAATFKGIIRALTNGGPYWQEGLNAMRLLGTSRLSKLIAGQRAQLGESIGVPNCVFSPDTHITKVAPLALGLKSTTSSTAAPVSLPATVPCSPKVSPATPSAGDVGTIHASGERTQPNDVVVRFDAVNGDKGTRLLLPRLPRSRVHPS